MDNGLLERGWRVLPAQFGNWKSVHKRFTRWAGSGIWQRIFQVLLDDPDNPYVMIDCTIVRAHQQPAGGRRETRIGFWVAPWAG